LIILSKKKNLKKIVEVAPLMRLPPVLNQKTSVTKNLTGISADYPQGD
jgi:hypothetical protein